MNLIFLDVDGVLNSQKFAKKMLEEENIRVYANDMLDTHALRLLKVLVEKTDALIIVTSSWRRIPESYNNLERQIQQFGMYISDCTPNTGNKRGGDITAWFNRHPGKYNYVILDDDSDMTVHMEHLVKTSFDDGLTRADVDKAIWILKGVNQ